MAKEIKIVSFTYPGCIIVCNGSAKFVNGNLPEIARIFKDRHVEWQRKRITQQMRDHVERLAREPFVAISASLTKKFNIYNYVANDKFRPALNGVFHEEGNRVASDKYILVALKEGYDHDVEGKIIGPDGAEINQAYPKWQSIIPKQEKLDKEYKAYPVTAEKREAFKRYVEEKRLEYKAAHGKGTKWQEWWYVKFGPAYFKAKYFDLLLTAMDRIGADGIMMKDEKFPCVAKTVAGSALLMPVYLDDKSDHSSILEL